MIQNKNFRVPTILLTMMVFFGHLLPIINYYHMLIVVLACTMIAAFVNQGKISINNNITWLICVIILMISLIFSYNSLETLKFSLMFFCILFIKMMYEGQENWQSFLIKCFLCASFIHVVLTLAQFMFPDVITSLNSLILAGNDYYTNVNLLNRGAFAGITGQTGINSFYISIFIAIVFCKLINSSNRKLIFMIALAIAMIALLLTVKRSQVIVNGVAMLIVFFVFSKGNKESIFNFVKIPFLVVIVGYFILTNIPATNTVIEKFSMFAESSDFTNGRMYLWNATINIFNEHPIIGVGAGTIGMNLDEMTHNIYIQMLGEMGILGFVSFTMAFILSVLKTLKIINICLRGKSGSNIQKYSLALGLYLQIYFILYGLSGNPLYSPIYLIVYMQMISIVNSSYLKRNKLIKNIR